MRRIAILLVIVVLAGGLAAAPRHLASRALTSPDFVHFETAHVHPAALTPSGNRLLVVNTPDARLSVFDVSVGAPAKHTRVAEIPVGLEPVSVAALSDSEAWVVNQLSDDVSIVNLNTGHVRATLRVGDEPSDVVFAGTPTRAYVSVSQEDVVKIYDPANLAAAPTVVAIAGQMPRALARNAAGTFVYAAVFHGGNRTSIVAPEKIPVDSMPVDPQMPRDPGLPSPPPRVGLIVQQQSGNWSDMYGNLWNSKIKYTMPDADVAEINTTSQTVARNFAGMGSVNFNIAVSPTDGRIGVVNTEGRELLRFEPRLIGYLVETQVTWATTSGAVNIRKLDNHINYDVVPGTQAEADSALGIPVAIAYASNGGVAYVASYATAKIGVVNPFGSNLTTVKARIPTVQGPSGIVVDDARGRIYVVGRFRNEVQTLSTFDFTELGRSSIGFDPTPDDLVNGRRIFYGGFTSAHGDQSCATCHVFGDTDNLAWDLGDPFGNFIPPPVPNPDGLHGYDPMKGPLVTQSLRGMANTEPLHWRGDRLNFAAFNAAFVSLMGRAASLPDSQMTALTTFTLAMNYPPNPSQNLDRTWPDAAPGQPSAARGNTFFTSTAFDSLGRKCIDCHSGVPGTDRVILAEETFLGSQDLKVPHLRNMHRKTGYRDSVGVANKRGFGYSHDGSVDNLGRLLSTPGLHKVTDAGDRDDVAAYLMGFDSGIAPAVGYQVTFTGPNNSDASDSARVDTLMAQADAGNCELIAKGRVAGQPRSWLYLGSGQWKPDRAALPNVTADDLRALGGLGSELTITGVPVSTGARMALDRDRDGYYDGDEQLAGSDTGNPGSTPGNVGVPGDGTSGFAWGGIRPNPFRAEAEVHFSLGRPGRVDLAVFDVLGREVKPVARGLWLAAGSHSLRWDGTRADGSRAAAGVYFVRLRTDGGTWNRAVVRVR